jgi:hypothetical protein
LRQVINVGGTACRFDLGLASDSRCTVAGRRFGMFVFEHDAHQNASGSNGSEDAIDEHAQV